MENCHIFGDFIFSNRNCCINTSSHPSLLKRADIVTVHKKDSKSVKNNYRPVSYCQTSPSCMKESCLNMPEYFESSFFLNISVDFGRVLVLRTV